MFGETGATSLSQVVTPLAELLLVLRREPTFVRGQKSRGPPRLHAWTPRGGSVVQRLPDPLLFSIRSIVSSARCLADMCARMASKTALGSSQMSGAASGFLP